MKKQELLKNIVQVADYFDEQGMDKEADVMDKIMKKVALEVAELEEMSDENIPLGDPLDELNQEFVGIVMDNMGLIKHIMTAFPEWESKMIRKIVDGIRDMPNEYLYEACRLLMSWASDAQHSLAYSKADELSVDDESKEAWGTKENADLNLLKRKLMNFMDKISKIDFGASRTMGFPREKSDVGFRDKFTGNY